MRERFKIRTMAKRKPFRLGVNYYVERSAAMKQLGFSSYTEYLDSDLWRSIRSSVLSRDEHKCCGCGKRASQVHHSRYDYRTMAGVSLEELHSVCSSCHKGAHKIRPLGGNEIKKEYRKERKKRRANAEQPKQQCPKCGVRKNSQGLCKKCRRTPWVIGEDGYKKHIKKPATGREHSSPT